MATRDDFEGWLMFMDDAIEQFMGDIPGDLARQLDYTPESLSVLEGWLLTKYESPESILKESESYIFDRVGRYVGETIRRNLPVAEWDINLEDEEEAYFGVPILRKGNDWVDCPTARVTTSLDRRTGTCMERLLRVLIEEQTG